MLDCPVSGTGAQAVTGDLVMMMSGPDNAVRKARPIAELFTKKVIEAGEFGAGTIGPLVHLGHGEDGLHITCGSAVVAEPGEILDIGSEP